MALSTNYIPDVNRFNLAGPPNWWLAKLWEFDNSLVVIPSRQGFMYRLAQRRKLRLPEKIVNEALFQQSDTHMLARHGLVPVTTIIATANWANPFMFQELAERAPWRQGGADKVNAQIEANEQAAEQRLNAAQDEQNTHLAKDGWKLYRKKIGLGRTWHGPILAPKFS